MNKLFLFQNGMSSLLWAVKCKNLDLIETYIDKGADISVKDENGDDALIHAVKSTDWDEESVVKYHATYKDYFDLSHKNKVCFNFHCRIKNQEPYLAGKVMD